MEAEQGGVYFVLNRDDDTHSCGAPSVVFESGPGVKQLCIADFALHCVRYAFWDTDYGGGFRGAAKELEEAAFIHGASIYRIFFHIILPLLMPALSMVAILTFLSSWNELMLAVTFVSDSRFKTITTGLMELIGKYSTQWGPVGAGPHIRPRGGQGKMLFP